MQNYDKFWLKRNQKPTLSLDSISIPGQAVSLAAISQCWSNVSHAESIFSTAVALRIDPVRKLTVGREQQVTSRLMEAAAVEIS